MTHQGRMHLWAQEQSQTRRHFILFCFVHGTKYIYVYTSKPTKKITSISTSNMYFFDTMQCTFFFLLLFIFCELQYKKLRPLALHRYILICFPPSLHSNGAPFIIPWDNSAKKKKKTETEIICQANVAHKTISKIDVFPSGSMNSILRLSYNISRHEPRTEHIAYLNAESHLHDLFRSIWLWLWQCVFFCLSVQLIFFNFGILNPASTAICMHKSRLFIN